MNGKYYIFFQCTYNIIIRGAYELIKRSAMAETCGLLPCKIDLGLILQLFDIFKKCVIQYIKEFYV